jgi:HlyD family secretion protein
MIRDTSAQDRTVAAPPRSRKRIATIAVIAVVALLLAGFAAPKVSRWFSASRAFDASTMRMAEVRRGTLVRDVVVPGRVVAAVSPTLYAPAAGTVTLKVKAGDQVQKDDVLAELVSPEITSTLQQEEAALSSLGVEVSRGRLQSKQAQLLAQRNLDEALIAMNAAKRERERAEAAWAKQAISQVEYRKAQDALETAEINHRHAGEEAKLQVEATRFEQETRELTLRQQQLKVTELRRVVDGLSVRAPVTGMVGSVAVPDKTNVAINAPLMTVVDLTVLEVEVQIPESYADDLGLGMAALVRFGSESFAGEIAAVAPEITQSQVIGRVRFSGEQPPSLRQNQRVNVRVVIESKPDVLMVARGPFLDAGGGHSAYLVNDGLALRTPIEVGATSVSDVEIVQGLKAGDRIVISSTETFEGADRVIINE